MANSENTQKIDNDHADEEIEVEGSSVSSKSDEASDRASPAYLEERKPVRGVAGELSSAKPVTVTNGYDPADYSSLDVSPEVKELFKMIQRYTPTQIDIETKLRAFIPEYIPAVGEVDAFLKMPRPDGQPETLGLTVLDEPALNQSNRPKLELELGYQRKQYTEKKATKIHTIEKAEKRPKDILEWIRSVGEINKTKQPPAVSYNKPMPEIDTLMQEWPAEVEETLSEVALPPDSIDLSLAEYTRLACCLLDIPVHANSPNSLIESLHVLFTLYSVFNENEHFQNQKQEAS